MASPKTANGALAEVDDAAATGGAAGASSQKMPNEAAAAGEAGAGCAAGASSQKMPNEAAGAGEGGAGGAGGLPGAVVAPCSECVTELVLPHCANHHGHTFGG